MSALIFTEKYLLMVKDFQLVRKLLFPTFLSVDLIGNKQCIMIFLV